MSNATIPRRTIEVRLAALDRKRERLEAERERLLGSETERERKRSDRIAAMLDLRKAGQSLETIGQQFNITRERVRQLIGNGTERAPRVRKISTELAVEMWKAGRTNREIAESFNVSESLVLRVVGPSRVNYFHRVMTHWLWDAGYFRCAECSVWEKGIKKFQRCRDCNRRKASEHYHSERGRELHKKWVAANPEKQREYQLRWRRKRGIKPRQPKQVKTERQSVDALAGAFQSLLNRRQAGLS